MAKKRAFDKFFIEGTIHTVAQNGIENTRTKDVADYAGFSEATMFRQFDTKDDLLRQAFLYIDKEVSYILMKSDLIRNPDETPFEFGFYVTWRQVYRHLIIHREETIYLIRYRYSSCYTDEVRNMRQAFNGGLDRAYEVLEKHFGEADHTRKDIRLLISFIFEMTLGYAEKVITGNMINDQNTENIAWLAVSSAVKSWAKGRREEYTPVTEKNLRNLNRHDLMNLLLQQQRQTARLMSQINELKAQGTMPAFETEERTPWPEPVPTLR